MCYIARLPIQILNKYLGEKLDRRNSRRSVMKKTREKKTIYYNYNNYYYNYNDDALVVRLKSSSWQQPST